MFHETASAHRRRADVAPTQRPARSSRSMVPVLAGLVATSLAGCAALAAFLVTSDVGGDNIGGVPAVDVEFVG